MGQCLTGGNDGPRHRCLVSRRRSGLARAVAALAAAIAIAGLAFAQPAAAQGGPSLTGPPAGSTVGIPGPFAGPLGTFEGPYFPLSWSCGSYWTLTVDPDVGPGPVGGLTSNIDQESNPGWRNLLLIRGARVDLPATRTLAATLVCQPVLGDATKVTLHFSTTVKYAEGPEGVTPPGGTPPNTPPPGCPEAVRLLASARYWNGLAQGYRGRSVKARQAVIDYANQGFKAFMGFFDGFAGDMAGDQVAGKTERKLLALEWEGIKRVWLDNDEDVARQIQRLRQLRKYFKGLGPIGELEGGLHVGEGLYYLGLAAQQGVLRDSWDALADDALAEATEQQRLAARACNKQASGSTSEPRAGSATAKKRPAYAKLPKPETAKTFRVSRGAGLDGQVARMLNTLLAAQERTTALARVIGRGVSRSRSAGAAGSAKWAARQLKHARATARKLAAFLESQALRRERSGAALTGTARQAATVEIANPAGLAAALRRLGLPATVRAALRRQRLKSEPFLRLLTNVPAAELVVPSLADAVADPTGVARDREWVADLRRFAAGP